MRGGMKKASKYSFLIFSSYCCGTCPWKQNNRNGYEMISQPKITDLTRCLTGMLALISSVYNEDFFVNHNGCHGI